MRLKLALLTTALAFGLGVPAALAQQAPADDPASTMQKDESQAAPEQSAPASPDEGGAAQQQSPPADESAPQ
jgi:hypothetical protein